MPAEYREIGATGLRVESGRVMEEYQRQLEGEKSVKVYREMGDSDPIVGAVLFAIEMRIRGLHWDVEPYHDPDSDPTPDDLANAEFVEECMDDMSHTWADHVADALSFVRFGWSWAEIVYKQRSGFVANDGRSSAYSDGRIGWRKLAPRSQDSLHRWEIDEQTGDVLGFWQQTGSTAPVLIPVEKSLHFRASRWKNNPEGRSVLRTAYRSWHFKRRIEEAEAIGIERDLAGIPKIGVPPEILGAADGSPAAAARTKWENIGKNLRADEQAFVMYPRAFDETTGNELYSVELMGTNARRLIDTGAVIDRHARGIAMSVLADVILIGHNAVGSYALSTTKDQMFTAALQAFVDEIANVDRAYAVQRLFALNGLPADRLPYLRPERIETVDLAALGSFLRDAIGSGAIEPDLETENWIRGRVKLPMRVDDGDMLDETAPLPPARPAPGPDETELDDEAATSLTDGTVS